MDENLQLFVRKNLERLFHSTRSRGRRSENRELNRIDAGKSTASKTTDTITNTSFATPCTQNRRLLKYGDKKLVEIASKFATFFM